MFPGSVTIPRVHKFDELFSDVNVHVLAVFAGQVTKVKKSKKRTCLFGQTLSKWLNSN